MSATANKEQLNRRLQGNLGLLEARSLTNEEGKLKDKPEPQQTNVTALEEDYVQGTLTAFHAKMSNISFIHFICCNESFPGN